MKNVYIKLLILTMMLLCNTIAEAYTITGQIVDKESGTPLRKAVIIARNDSSKVLAGLNSDQNGQFTTANIDCQNVVLEISRENYKTTYFAVSNETAGVIDIGKILLERKTIELQEVEVNAQSVIQKPDRYLIFPSAKEIARSASSLSLLNELKMKMPGLHVNEMLESVTIENRSPVFQINGKEVSFSRILTINNDNVLRIEYHDIPTMRYADRGVPGIINFVMKPRQDGGSVTASVNSALTTGNINANVGGTYYYKKSEWSLNYNNNWRRYDDQRISSTEQFIGRDMPIQRTETGLPSEMGYLTNRISLGYTYMHDANTMLSATIDGVFMNNAFRNAHSDNTQIYADETYKYKRHYNTDDDVAMPSLDIYFRKQIDKKSKIEIDAFASMSDGDYDRNVNHIYENDADNYYLSSMTQNSSWRTGLEGAYSRTYSKFTTTYGFRYYHNYAENDYAENGNLPTLDKLSTDYLYVYGGIVGRFDKLGYSAGVGGVYSHTKEFSMKKDAFRPKVNVTLNYQFPKNWSLNYLFIYDPSLPSLSQQSETVQTVDDISLRMGNMGLKPSTWFRNRIYLRYTYKKFTGTFWASHSRTTDPIFNRYTYIADAASQYYNKFMSQTANGSHDDRINLQLNVGFQELFNHLSIYGVIGYDRYDFTGFGNIDCDKRVYASAEASLYFGNWTLSGFFEIAPQYSLNGNVIRRAERWNMIQLQYRHKNWFFRCGIANPFTKRGALYGSKTLSDVHPAEDVNFIKDNANMVTFGVVYRVNFGKGFKKASRSIRNSGIDTGVNSDY